MILSQTRSRLEIGLGLTPCIFIPNSHMGWEGWDEMM